MTPFSGPERRSHHGVNFSLSNKIASGGSDSSFDLVIEGFGLEVLNALFAS